MSLTNKAPEPQCLKAVGLDDLAKRRLTTTLNDALDQGLEIIIGIRFKDEHIGLKVDRSGLRVSSRVRWHGLGAVVLAITGYLASLIY